MSPHRATPREPWFAHEERAATRGGKQTPHGWHDDRPAKTRVNPAADSYVAAVAELASLARDLDATGEPALATRARNILGRLGWVASAVAHA